jgi:hypothetical protein
MARTESETARLARRINNAMVVYGTDDAFNVSVHGDARERRYRVIAYVSVRLYATHADTPYELGTCYGDTCSSVVGTTLDTIAHNETLGYVTTSARIHTRYTDGTTTETECSRTDIVETLATLWRTDSETDSESSTETETETETNTVTDIAALTETAKRLNRETGYPVHIPTGTLIHSFVVMTWHTGNTYGYAYSLDTLDDARSEYETTTAPNRMLFAVPVSERVLDTYGTPIRQTVTALSVSPDGSDVIGNRNTNTAATLSESVRAALHAFMYETSSDESGYALATALLDSGYDTQHNVSVSVVAMDTESGLSVSDTVHAYVRMPQTCIRKASFVDIADSGNRLSYLPSSKISKDVQYYEYDATGRQTAKPSKVLRMLIRTPDAFADADYETVTNAIRAYASRSFGTFEIVTGDAIRDAYLEDGYAPSHRIGTLAHSCMRYRSCQSYFRIYTDNPETVSLLTYRNDDGELLGRALLWRTDSGDTYMDRVYGNDVIQRLFNTYATEHGYTDDASPVTVRNARFDKYPYMDTFRYLHPDTGTLATSEHYLPDGMYYVLESTSGYYETHNAYLECSECGTSYDADDDNGYDLCPDCYSERTCQHCGRFDYGDNHTDGYCPRCLPGYQCNDCGTVVDDRDDLTNGYCSDCSESHTCRVCEAVVDNLDTDSVCTDCLDNRCTVCLRFRSWHDVNDSYRADYTRHTECVACQRQPRLFELPYPHGYDAGRCVSALGHGITVPATGNVCIVDTVSETPSESRYPLFGDMLNGNTPDSEQWQYMPAYRYRYTPLGIDPVTYANNRTRINNASR